MPQVPGVTTYLHGALIGMDDGKGALGIGKVCDQRIETRSALGSIDPGNGFPVCGVCAQAVDGLRRERHGLAAAQQGGG